MVKCACQCLGLVSGRPLILTSVVFCMSLFEDQSRRRFVKTFVTGTAFAAVLGKPWRKTFLAEANPVAAGGNFGTLELKLSDYPTLLEEFSSVRIGVNGLENDGVTPAGFFYPIIVSRGPGNEFYALDAGCTHAGCVVTAYDNFEEAILCPCHGSAYAIDGTVLAGPAVSPLARMAITFDGQNALTISVPNLGYSVTSSMVQNTESPRLRLDFPTFVGPEYEVRFRENMATPWAVVPFATSPDGPLDNQSLIGNEQPATVYVARTKPAGFFAVAMKVLDLTLT